MAVKYYVILCTEDEFYLPIKAQINPTDPGRRQFLGGMPNFFGGRSDDGEGPFATMQREVEEESSMTAELFGVMFNPVFQGRYKADDYDFFYSRAWDLQPWPSEERWIRNGQAFGADYTEMCFVAKVERHSFDGLDTLSIGDIFRIIMQSAAAQAPDWARRQFSAAPSRTFMESETAKALKRFVELWLAGDLPGDIGGPDVQQARASQRGTPAGFPVLHHPSKQSRHRENRS